MASNNTTTFGATVVRPSTPQSARLPEPLTDSPALTPAVSRDGAYLQPNAKSSLYSHSIGSNLVVSHSHASSNIKDAIAVFEKDVESGNVTPVTPDDDNPFGKDIRVSNNKEDEMWPSKQTLKQKQKAEKRTRRDVAFWGRARNRWSALPTRQRLYAKIITAVLLVGLAVALGVGISSAVKGTYFVSDGSNRTVG